MVHTNFDISTVIEWALKNNLLKTKDIEILNIKGILNIRENITRTYFLFNIRYYNSNNDMLTMSKNYSLKFTNYNDIVKKYLIN